MFGDSDVFFEKIMIDNGNISEGRDTSAISVGLSALFHLGVNILD